MATEDNCCDLTRDFAGIFLPVLEDSELSLKAKALYAWLGVNTKREGLDSSRRYGEIDFDWNNRVMLPFCYGAGYEYGKDMLEELVSRGYVFTAQQSRYRVAVTDSAAEGEFERGGLQGSLAYIISHPDVSLGAKLLYTLLLRQVDRARETDIYLADTPKEASKLYNEAVGFRSLPFLAELREIGGVLNSNFSGGPNGPGHSCLIPQDKNIGYRILSGIERTRYQTD